VEQFAVAIGALISRPSSRCTKMQKRSYADSSAAAIMALWRIVEGVGISDNSL